MCQAPAPRAVRSRSQVWCKQGSDSGLLDAGNLPSLRHPPCAEGVSAVVRSPYKSARGTSNRSRLVIGPFCLISLNWKRPSSRRDVDLQPERVFTIFWRHPRIHGEHITRLSPGKVHRRLCSIPSRTGAALLPTSSAPRTSLLDGFWYTKGKSNRHISHQVSCEGRL